MQKILIAATVAVSLSGPATASSECTYAVDSYNSAVDDISYGLKRYAQCVEASQGSDDCSSEFRRLKNAQDDFETAVSNYQIDCER
jgi:hypothetical protein